MALFTAINLLAWRYRVMKLGFWHTSRTGARGILSIGSTIATSMVEREAASAIAIMFGSLTVALKPYRGLLTLAGLPCRSLA